MVCLEGLYLFLREVKVGGGPQHYSNSNHEMRVKAVHDHYDLYVHRNCVTAAKLLLHSWAFHVVAKLSADSLSGLMSWLMYATLYGAVSAMTNSMCSSHRTTVLHLCCRQDGLKLMHCMQHAQHSTTCVHSRYMQLKLQARDVPGFWLALFAGGAAVAAFASTLRLTCSWKLPICRTLSELNRS